MCACTVAHHKNNNDRKLSNLYSLEVITREKCCDAKAKPVPEQVSLFWIVCAFDTAKQILPIDLWVCLKCFVHFAEINGLELPSLAVSATVQSVSLRAKIHFEILHLQEKETTFWFIIMKSYISFDSWTIYMNMKKSLNEFKYKIKGQ